MATIVAYKRAWTSAPPDSRAFKVAAGHQNPVLGIEPTAARAKQARVSGTWTAMGELAPGPRIVAHGAGTVRLHGLAKGTRAEAQRLA